MTGVQTCALPILPAWLASVSGSLSWLSLPSRCPRRYNAASHRLKRHRWRCNSSLVRKVLFVLDQLGQAAARNADAIIADGLCLRQFGLQLFGWCGHARMIDATPAACNHSRATGSAYYSHGSENRRFSNRGRAVMIRSEVVCSVWQCGHTRSRITKPAVCFVR